MKLTGRILKVTLRYIAEAPVALKLDLFSPRSRDENILLGM